MKLSKKAPGTDQTPGPRGKSNIHQYEEKMTKAERQAAKVTIAPMNEIFLIAALRLRNIPCDIRL
jgi:hypothetical protein